MLFLGAMVVSASAQTRTVVVSRPIIVRPYVGSFYGWRDPFWRWDYYNSYSGDPFYWEMRQRYYDQQSLRDARKKLAKDQAKYRADGYLTPKEQEKLAKDQRNYYKALQRVRQYG